MRTVYTVFDKVAWKVLSSREMRMLHENKSQPKKRDYERWRKAIKDRSSNPHLISSPPRPPGQPASTLPLRHDRFRFPIKILEHAHRLPVLQKFRHLHARTHQLQHVPIVLGRPTQVRARMAHLQAILEHRHHLLDLPVVQQPGGDAPLCRQPLQQVRPLGPFAVGGGLHSSLAGFEGDGEAVLGDEVEGALAEAGVDFAEDCVLLTDIEGDGHGGEVGLQGGEGRGGRSGEVLRWTVKFVLVGAFLGVVRLLLRRPVLRTLVRMGGFAAVSVASVGGSEGLVEDVVRVILRVLCAP